MVLSIKDKYGQETYKQYYVPNVAIKDVSTTGCLLDYPYFKKYHKLIAIDLSKQQKLDSGPKEMHQLNFIWNLTRAKGPRMLFIIEDWIEIELNWIELKIWGKQ